jgi:predicted nucleic acid-binding protein
MTSAVADAGPLIHLAEIRACRLLNVFAQLHIPRAVELETIGQGRVSLDELAVLNNLHWHQTTLTGIGLTEFVQNHGLGNLQAGEQEALNLCLQLGVSILLTDDLAVREAARRLNLIPVGSLGVIVRAYRSKWLTLAEAEDHLNRLQVTSSLFVTSEIVKLAIEQLRQAD